MMAEDDAPLRQAILTIIDAARACFAAGRDRKEAFITRVLQATDNPRIIAALAACGHPLRASAIATSWSA
jgi:hypothetical protein